MDHTGASQDNTEEQPGLKPGEVGLAALWENARDAIFAYLLAEIGTIHDAEDLLQEVAVAVAKNFHKHDREHSFVAWALGIARNKALMYYRQRKRDRLAFGEDMMRIVASHLETMPSRSDDQRREALLECLRSLSQDRRSLLKMRYSREMNLVQISESMGVSVPALKGQLFRVRKVLAKCVQRRLATR
ncbi:sigma-70 family RNA polymerase sigma factor [Aeoliella sp. ICT_H6.2]|uniref:Sigma-70 family RNA polymerase sigma factor n=1 Tax=Aeoliella straminimaris TaxID=2954799 RepID=A0A9X2JKI5_9BACT|nr:sigma-70 family RNA polymerase sigma factor [Aeoliella straminimaris]MCO6046619.1 sigma-70 family RNA polymerase sigma factor [Aeoliella straminimaris]